MEEDQGGEEGFQKAARGERNCGSSTRSSEWHLVRVYSSHPACRSKPLECFEMLFLAFQLVFKVSWGAAVL